MSLYVNICHEFNICHYWYFLNTWLKFQSNICVKCHNLLMMSMNFSDVAIVNTVEKLLYSQGTFSLSRNFSTVKKLFHSQKTFLQWRNLFTNKKVFRKQESFSHELFLDQRSFPQTKIFTQSKKFLQAKKKEVVTFLTLKIQKGFKLKKLSTHKKHFLTHFNTLCHLVTSKIEAFKGFRKRLLKLNVLIDKVLQICYFFD